MVDDSSDPPIRRQASIKKFVSRVWKESSVTAVSAIVSTRSVPRKVFRVLVLVLFTTGFLYQCIQFLSYIFSYPTIVNIDIRKPDFYLTPAYTFCNYNVIKRSKFCHKYPEKCINPDENFCKKYSIYCGDNEAKVPREECFFKENYTMEEFLDLGYDVGSFLIKKEPEGDEEASGPYSRVRNEETNEMSLCYSFHSRVNSPLEPHMTKRQSWWDSSEHSFVFDPEEREVFSPNDKPGMIFEVHSPFVAVNPFDKGIFLRPGYSYKITISMQEEELLPYPYETDCMNYTEVWLSNNREGPRSQKSCQDYCYAEAIIYCFNCVHPLALYPSKTRLCSQEELAYSPCLDDTTVPNTELAEIMFDSCSKKCKDDCLQMKYTYRVSEIYNVPKWTKEDNNKEPRLIKVQIKFEDSEIVALHYKPQFQEVEAFSYIGGFIGVWLGISLVQIADVFESLFRIARYYCKKGGSFCCKKSTTSKNEEF